MPNKYAKYVVYITLHTAQAGIFKKSNLWKTLETLLVFNSLFKLSYSLKLSYIVREFAESFKDWSIGYCTCAFGVWCRTIITIGSVLSIKRSSSNLATVAVRWHVFLFCWHWVVMITTGRLLTTNRRCISRSEYFVRLLLLLEPCRLRIASWRKCFPWKSQKLSSCKFLSNSSTVIVN